MKYWMTMLCAAGLTTLGLFAAQQPAQASETIDQAETLYNSIYIYQDGDYVSMLFGRNRRLYQESRANTEDPLELPATYTQYMTLGLAYAAKQERLLEIGVGGGSTIAYLARTAPKLEIDAVEIDGVVIDFANKYFFLEENENLRVHIRDGRRHLMLRDDVYDVILVDAYRGPFVPFHLLTKEFFELAKRRLTPGGALVQNVDPTTILYDSTVATIGAVFAHVDVYAAKGNYVLVAYDGEKLSDAELVRRAEALDAALSPRYPFARMAAERREASGADGRVLTDDFAPVEAMKAIDRNNTPE